MSILFPYYSGNIKLTKVLGHVSLERFIYSIKNPNEKMLDLFNKIKSEPDKAKRRELKWNLYSFTPTVVINVGYKRRLENVIRYNPIIQIDIDNVDKKEVNNVKEKLFSLDYCITAFVTPSGKGVKGIMLINEPTSLEHYKAIHKALHKNLTSFKGIDLATKNAVLPLFLCYDKDILYRDIGECAVFDDEDWSINEGLNPLNNKTTKKYNRGENRLTNRVLSNSRYAIENIVDNGHPQIRRAALIMGSRIGAGYIDRITGTNHIINLMKSNKYLSKNVKGYEKTILWGIENGIKNPIRFKDE